MLTIRFPLPSRQVRARLLARFAAASKALPQAHDGAVAMLFALILLPLAAIVGAALDYSRATDARTTLTAAADAAALSTVASSAMTLTAAKAQAMATDLFNTRIAGTPFAQDVNVTVTVVDSGLGRATSVSFGGGVSTTLMKLAGWSTIPIAGSAKAASAPPTYIDFHLLLDNSPSMGVAATTSDITKMMAATSDQCAFACHIDGSTNDYYALAKSKSIQMRIDVVRSATQQLMDTATSSAAVSGQYRAAVNTFGTTCSAKSLTTISALTSNLAAVKSSANGIDLMSIPYQNYNNDQCTDLDAMLAAAGAQIGTPGNGSFPTAPQKVLFFVSDGVADTYNPSSCSRSANVPGQYGRCQAPITNDVCTAIKNRGIKIAVLYTTYLPLPSNDWYNTWIAPFSSTIPTKMQSCASPGLFFEVSPSQGISDAMTALFKLSVAQARLSQ